MPGATVRVVPLSLPANGASAAPLLVTVIAKSAAVLVPPLSLITCLMTVSVAVGAAMSSLMIVQVFVSPTPMLPPQPADRVLAYPVWVASSTLYEPALSVTAVPPSLPAKGAFAAPLLVTVIEKSEATLVPPSSFTTCFITVSCAAMSLLVIVQVRDSPVAIVPVQPADKLAV